MNKSPSKDTKLFVGLLILIYIIYIYIYIYIGLVEYRGLFLAQVFSLVFLLLGQVGKERTLY